MGASVEVDLWLDLESPSVTDSLGVEGHIGLLVHNQLDVPWDRLSYTAILGETWGA